ncbi:tetratricopeptide repeat protein [Actinoplanes missouriensis]|uniref:tetratricopeptide repeat protein n=1 Tax=Actinoplanes missouriensis TaxID=1866 RepID=UPI00155DB1E4|nr:tetratricopeptide repeat protein [Actinoplanes missouriensis]
MWITASSRDEIVAGFCRLAGRLGVGADERDDDAVAELALSRLRQPGWYGLIVLDNADDPFEVSGWIPTTGDVTVIVTTTNRSFADMTEIVTVDGLTDDEAASYLETRTRIGLPGAHAIAAELGNLALALAQAAAVIPLRGYSADDYITQLRSTRLENLFAKTVGYPHTLTQAIVLSLNAVREVERGSELIEALAWLDPAGVSRRLITRLESDLLPGSAHVSLTSELVKNSLLLWSETYAYGSVHRVVSRVIREDAIRRDEIYGSLYWTVEALRGATRIESAPSAWLTELIEQSSWVFKHALDVHESLTGDQVHWLLEVGDSMTQFSWTMGLLAPNFRCCQALSELAAARLPSDSPLRHRAHSRYVLALHGRGRIDAAFELGERLSGEIAAGSTLALEHQALMIRVHLSRGDATGAVAVGRRALQAAEAASRTDDLPLNQIRNNLGLALHELGLYEEERTLYTRALEESRAKLHPDHPLLLHLENNLANLLGELGLWRESVEAHSRVLESRRRTMGDLHPDTVRSLGNLASAATKMGDYEQGRRLDEEAAAAAEAIHGKEHPETLIARANLASAYAKVGLVEKALLMDEEILETRRRILGPDHPAVLVSMNNLAQRYRAAGRPDDGLTLLREVLRIREASIGEKHPDTMLSRSNLAHALVESGNTADAIDLERKSLEQRREVLGENHPDTILSMNNLANYYFAADAVSEARELLERAVEGMEALSLQRHPMFLTMNANLLGVLVLAGDKPAALTVFERLAVSADELDRIGATTEQRTFAELAKRAVADPDFLDTLMRGGPAT